jgi:3-phenylpropionate/cinnamic acid dioxygenase small subunit
MTSDPVFVRRVEEFLFHEARLLDEREFEAWMALFSDDGIYWIPATPGQQDPLGEVSIAYEDRQLLDVRVRRLRHPENYADQPQARTRRVIGNVMLDEGDSVVTVVRSNFMLVEIQNDAQRMFAGEYVHTLKPAGDSFQIVQKRVDLLNCDAPMGGIVIPF